MNTDGIVAALPNGIAMCQLGGEYSPQNREDGWMKNTIIGVDLAKAVFELHGAAPDGRPVFRKKLSRNQFLRFMSQYPDAVVAMEACGRPIAGLVNWCSSVTKFC